MTERADATDQCHVTSCENRVPENDAAFYCDTCQEAVCKEHVRPAPTAKGDRPRNRCTQCQKAGIQVMRVA